MKIYLFCHSVISDWNHGNAHFLRGIAASLIAMGHRVRIMEPGEGWSLKNLLSEKPLAFSEFREVFPYLMPMLYSEKSFDPRLYLEDADLVIVHEWNNPSIVAKIGEFRKVNRKMVLLFHDTHHRSATAPEEMSQYDLRNYDGVLASGEAIRKIYLEKGWARNVWTWHEAADDRIFHPMASKKKDGDLVWIGNWGDGDRTEEIREFIVEPVRQLGLKAAFFGVRYPPEALRMLKKAGIAYKGWIPNYQVPEIFGRYRMTVHVPRKPYTESLTGIPTIRPFEAMACGIPLICSPWKDSENLFTSGKDYLLASDGAEMRTLMKEIIDNPAMARALSYQGLSTIRKKHTCDHRADQLAKIINEIDLIRNKNIIHRKVPM